MAPVISGDRKQLTLQLDGGLVERFRHVRDVVAQGVYKRGLAQCIPPQYAEFIGRQILGSSMRAAA